MVSGTAVKSFVIGPNLIGSSIQLLKYCKIAAMIKQYYMPIFFLTAH